MQLPGRKELGSDHAQHITYESCLKVSQLGKMEKKLQFILQGPKDIYLDRHMEGRNSVHAVNSTEHCHSVPTRFQVRASKKHMTAQCCSNKCSRDESKGALLSRIPSQAKGGDNLASF